MLTIFQIEDCKPVSTPMTMVCNLCADVQSPNVDQKKYRSIIGSMLYLTTFGLDIMLEVKLVARY